MNREKLWVKRSGERFRELFRYSRYMFNDHLLFVIIIGVGGGAYYYQNWVHTLSPQFPTAILFSIVFGVLLAYGNIITFFKQADKVFLLPLETKLHGYLRRSALLTILWHWYISGLSLLILAPIFFQTEGDSKKFFLFTFVILILKLVNLFIRWYVDFETDRLSVIVDLLFRILFNGFIVYFYLTSEFPFVGITSFIFIAYGVYFFMKNRTKPLPWERLVTNEERRMGTFYRIANLFTDVPQLRNQVKRRRWLDLLLKNVRFSPNQTYVYLLNRTFFRSGDYFGLFMRLTIIGAILLFETEGAYFRIFLAVLFMYLTGFQLWGLWMHHRSILWISLYPVNEKDKERAFLNLLARTLSVQMILFILLLLLLGEWTEAFVLFGCLILFLYLFIFIYTKNRIKNWRS
ncbi:ABC transporter permease [Fervidibacillus halotolerans]|uniref:ABC transporter permease n=1 Tax=Fervidibacillus halotolerans TaxID=2980027 RepID=A0A9E8M0C6_9BACI|nr:ABC transporter permease [Fervidibacillus halotolerans]WAA13017.1 ABC transporter permease [Fervidibacillus halotolerans]